MLYPPPPLRSSHLSQGDKVNEDEDDNEDDDDDDNEEPKLLTVPKALYHQQENTEARRIRDFDRFVIFGIKQTRLFSS